LARETGERGRKKEPVVGGYRDERGKPMQKDERGGRSLGKYWRRKKAGKGDTLKVEI